MAWTTPYVWTTGWVVTAAKLNEQLKDNLRYLKGLDGTITLSDGIAMGDNEISGVKSIDFTDFLEVTIATGAITVTQTCHTVDTESNAGSDDLATINGGTNGMMIVLKPVDDTRTIVVKHNTGNIWLQGKVDISLDDLEDGLLLVYSGTKWIDLAAGIVDHGDLSGLGDDDHIQYALRTILTNRGDIIFRDASNNWARLAKGTDGEFLKIGANDPIWAEVGTKSIATGSYTGNDAASRQITVGFKCSLVFIAEIGTHSQWTLIPSHALWHKGSTDYHKWVGGLNVALHASDGFIVGHSSLPTDSANENSVTYYYWAISE